MLYIYISVLHSLNSKAKQWLAAASPSVRLELFECLAGTLCHQVKILCLWQYISHDDVRKHPSLCPNLVNFSNVAGMKTFLIFNFVLSNLAAFWGESCEEVNPLVK